MNTPANDPSHAPPQYDEHAAPGYAAARLHIPAALAACVLAARNDWLHGAGLGVYATPADHARRAEIRARGPRLFPDPLPSGGALNALEAEFCVRTTGVRAALVVHVLGVDMDHQTECGIVTDDEADDYWRWSAAWVSAHPALDFDVENA